MRPTPMLLSVSASLTLALTACGESAEPATDQAGEPVTAAPADAPGISEEALETNQAIFTVGRALRNLEDATGIEQARDALAQIEQNIAAVAGNLPQGVRATLQDDFAAAQQAVAANDLEQANEIGERMLTQLRDFAPAGQEL